MNGWLMLIFAATAGSLLSLIGGLYLLYGKRGTRTLQAVAVPLAAGALLAAAFLDLLPEALEQQDAKTVMLTALVGILLFFVLERSLGWFHHHHDEGDAHASHGRRQNTSLIVVGDTIHNFIDGLAIGAAFLVDPAIGVVTTVAVAAHEIPQELGDFGLLLSKGMMRRNVLLVNLLSALATVIGAVIVYGFGDSLHISEPILLALTAGFFIYIAASDVIPTIHAESRHKWAFIQTVVLLLSVVGVGLLAQFSHGFIESNTDSDSHGSIHHD